MHARTMLSVERTRPTSQLRQRRGLVLTVEAVRAARLDDPSQTSLVSSIEAVRVRHIEARQTVHVVTRRQELNLHPAHVGRDRKERVELPYTPQPARVGLAVQHEQLLTRHLKDRQASQRVTDRRLIDADLVQPECRRPSVLGFELVRDLLQLGVLERRVVRPRVRDEEVLRAAAALAIRRLAWLC